MKSHTSSRSQRLHAMAEAEADIQAGRTVDSATVMRRLDQSIAEMQPEITGAAR